MVVPVVRVVSVVPVVPVVRVVFVVPVGKNVQTQRRERKEGKPVVQKWSRRDHYHELISRVWPVNTFKFQKVSKSAFF